MVGTAMTVVLEKPKEFATEWRSGIYEIEEALIMAPKAPWLLRLHGVGMCGAGADFGTCQLTGSEPWEHLQGEKVKEYTMYVIDKDLWPEDGMGNPNPTETMVSLPGPWTKERFEVALRAVGEAMWNK
ncbi:hypothetical protein TrVE_jg10174 [Triparma verrucosa]|uniref:Uncharacterized protein n=1 Tax=Triparma verrucosa TaxID=1606542 RepID=A0A9W7EL61_9STRA|nr:hypothetical protein TrVE_jg10174 [Triparma verrucosa]